MTSAGLTLSADQAVEIAIAALKGTRAASTLPLVDQALRRWPGDPRLWHLKGLLHRAEERRELALPHLRKAAQIAPREPMIAHALARTLNEAGLPSVDAYANALRLAPGDPSVMTGMVSALLSARRTDEAVAGLRGALAQSPLWAQGHVLLSEVRWMLGERAGFARSFQQALAKHPGDLVLRRLQIITLLHAKSYDEALASIAEGRRVLRDQEMLDANEAVIRSDLGEYERADTLFAHLSELTDSTVQVQRTRHLLRTGRLHEASALIDPWLVTDQAYMFWPYASLTWRMLGDARWEWLERDERLVGVYDLSDRLSPLEHLAGSLRELHKASAQPLAQSVRGGTQTDGNLFHRIDPTIVELREAIRTVTEEHAAQLTSNDPEHPLLKGRRSQISPIVFSGSWSVRLQAGGRHANHVHPMGWLSSALYVVLPPDAGKGPAGWLTLGEADAELKVDLPPFRMVEPKPGRLVLFPSTMWHGTRPFGKGERITVAFDVACPS